MNHKQAEEKYKSRRLVVEYGKDEPNKVYEPHRHEKTLLFTLAGSIKIKIDDGEWVLLESGQEFTVKSNQLHEARVGGEGWEYVAGWDEEEASHYEH